MYTTNVKTNVKAKKGIIYVLSIDQLNRSNKTWSVTVNSVDEIINFCLIVKYEQECCY